MTEPLIKFSIAQMEAAAAQRPPGYLDACLAAAHPSSDADTIAFTVEAYHELKRQFNPNGQSTVEVKIVAKPYEQWPRKVKLLALRRTSEDVGAGDTLHRIFAAFGVAAMVRAYNWLLGKSCNCQHRQDILNQTYPYEGLG